MTKTRLALITLLMLGVGLSSASAQIAAVGSVRGTVTDQQGAAVPGVTVTATPADAPPMVAVTDQQGAYRFVNLAPGTYAIGAQLTGFSKYLRPGVEIRAGLNIAVDIVMKLGDLSETVEVRSDTPMLEVAKPVQAVNISGEFQRALPLNPRHDWSDFLELTPGLTSYPLQASNGSQLYALRGGSVDGHVFQLDGADIGSFRQGLNSYTQLSTEALEDVQIKTGGVDAASPLGVGVVVNIATVSGTNKLKGSAGFSFTPSAWNGDNSDGGTASTNDLFQPELSLGGPILKDKLWFFGAYRYTRRNTGISRSATQLANLKILSPGFVPFDNENRLQYHYYKANGRLGGSNQYQVFYQRELNPEQNNPGSFTEPLSILSLGGQAYGGRLSTVFGSATTLRVSASYNDKGVNPTPHIFDSTPGHGPALSVYNGTVASGSILVGTGLIGSLNNIAIRVLSPASKTTVQADLTHFQSGRTGTHEIQTGVFLQPRLRSTTSFLYANDGFANESVVLRQPGNISGGFIPFARTNYDRSQLKQSSVTGSDYAIYVQDSWKPRTRLTVTAGLRVDNVKATDEIAGVQSLNTTAVGPRLGTTYMLTSDANNIVRANWARVHSAVGSGIFNPGVASAGAGIVQSYDVNLDGTFDTFVNTPAFTRVTTARQIDPDRHLPFTDEWIVGYRRQLRGQFTFDASVVHRDYKDRRALVEINGIYDNGVFKGYKDPSVNDIFLITNNTWNTLVYSGLEFLATKRTAKMQFIGSYTRAFRHISGTWQPNDPAGIIQPNAFANDKGIGDVGGNVTNSYNATGLESQSWQDHAARGGITYSAPWKILLATNYSFQSGPYSGPLLTNVAAPDPRFGPATVTLSNGRTVTNPLATTFRFASEPRGAGQLQAPSLHVWNLRAGRNFQLYQRRLDVAFDVFNVTNNGTDTNFYEDGNQLASSNFGRRADGTFNGTNRQFARAGQLTVRFGF
jgi:hypothetical protein